MMIKEYGLTAVSVALHNACVHGEVFAEAGYGITQAELDKLFPVLESLMAEAKVIEGE